MSVRVRVQPRASREAIAGGDFDTYYEKNLAFHNTFVGLCGNARLVTLVHNLKKRLYDFPRAQGFVKEWEEASIGEHQALVDLLRAGRSQEAAAHIRDVHWSFQVQERFVRRYYPAITKPGG